MARVVLIDDDKALRRSLRIALERSGHEIVEAANGREGLAAFAIQPADIVVTDIVMPELEGVELIQAIRKMSPRVPIIAISGGGRGKSADYLRLATFFGATQALEKPFTIDALRAAIAALLGPPAENPDRV